MGKRKIAGKTVTLKIKYSDFIIQTRSKTLPFYISDASLVLEEAKKLLYQEKLQNSVRLLGISLSNFKSEKKQEPLEEQLKFRF
jgi:DNA polymerase-4